MISLILALALVGVVIYLVEQLPMPPAFKLAIRVIALIAIVLYLVQQFGLDVPVPRLR